MSYFCNKKFSEHWNSSKKCIFSAIMPRYSESQVETIKPGWLANRCRSRSEWETGRPCRPTHDPSHNRQCFYDITSLYSLKMQIGSYWHRNNLESWKNWNTGCFSQYFKYDGIFFSAFSVARKCGRRTGPDSRASFVEADLQAGWEHMHSAWRFHNWVCSRLPLLYHNKAEEPALSPRDVSEGQYLSFLITAPDLWSYFPTQT